MIENVTFCNILKLQSYIYVYNKILDSRQIETTNFFHYSHEQKYQGIYNLNLKC